MRWGFVLLVVCARIACAQVQFAFTNFAGLPLAAGTSDGTGTAARFHAPYGVALDPAGNLYVADHDNHTIRKISPAGVVTTPAGSAGQPGSTDATANAARFFYPFGVAVDSATNLYVVDSF